MDKRWKKVYGKIYKTNSYVYFYLEVTAPNGLVISRRRAVIKSDFRWMRINLYSWTLNSMVREIEEQLERCGSMSEG